MRKILATLGVFVLLAVALAVAGATPAPPGPTDEAACGVESQGLEAAGPHCCGSGAGAACRDQCKAQGPGCKGQIGCRAGECVCTCSCP